jgi:hypothetical protein
MTYSPASSPALGGKKYPKVFLVILNHNGTATIKQCLSAVFLSNYPNLETVAVDNGSTDGSLEIIKTFFQKCPLISNKKSVGQAAGFNMGIRLALEKMADYILLLDNRIILTKETLSQMVEIAEKEKNIGIFSPLFLENNFGNILSPERKINWLKMEIEKNSKPFAKENGTRFRKIQLVDGHAMLIQKEVFKEVELLDENFFSFYWDIDFCFRAQKKGIVIGIIPNITPGIITHKITAEKNEIYWKIVSRLIFFKKNSPFLLIPWTFLYFFMQKLKVRFNLFFKPGSLLSLANRAYKDYTQWKKNSSSLS